MFCTTGKIYIAGGFSRHEVLRSVEHFDGQTGQWTYVAPMLSPRTGCNLVVFQDQLLCLGGSVVQSYLY